MRGSWIGLAVAHYLAGSPDEAVAAYDGLMAASQSDGSGMSKAEHAQLLLFIIKACREAGQAEEALRRLQEGVRRGVISERGEISAIKGELYGTARLSFDDGCKPEGRDGVANLHRRCTTNSVVIWG